VNILNIGGGLIAKVSKDWFTSADGQSYAIGKALGVFVTVVGSPLPWAVLASGHELSLTEAGIFYGGLGGAVMALVWGTHPTEPKIGTTEEKTTAVTGPNGTTITAITETMKPTEAASGRTGETDFRSSRRPLPRRGRVEGGGGVEAGSDEGPARDA